MNLEFLFLFFVIRAAPKHQQKAAEKAHVEKWLAINCFNFQCRITITVAWSFEKQCRRSETTFFVSQWQFS